MRLITESTLKLLQEYDEAVINKKFHPYAFYNTVQLSSVGLGTKIPNKEYKNNLYYKLNKYLEEGDTTRARKIINELKHEIDKDRGQINKYIEKQREEEENEEEITINCWHKNAIGILSYFDEE